MSTETERPWWSYTKEEQKSRIEDAVHWYLSQPGDLARREKLLLRDALGHTYKGLFGIAAHDLYSLTLPEGAWSETARVDEAMVQGLTRDTLRRALAALRNLPAQMRPVFM
jgi:hypothetical protein